MATLNLQINCHLNTRKYCAQLSSSSWFMIQRTLMMTMMMVITMTTCQQWVQSRGTKSLLLHHAKLFANDLLFYSTVITLFAANFVVLKTRKGWTICLSLFFFSCIKTFFCFVFFSYLLRLVKWMVISSSYNFI